MDESGIVRPAPRVIHVLPPEPSRIGRFVRLAALTLAVGLGILLVEIRVWDLYTLVFTGSLVAVIAVVFSLRGRLVRYRVRRIREQMLTEQPAWSDEPVAAQVARMWKWPTFPPHGAEIEDLARHLPTEQRDAAWVVCLGVPHVPPVGDMRFEPEVIAPGHRWRELLPAALWTALLVCIVFCCLGAPLVDVCGETIASVTFLALLFLSVALTVMGRMLLWPRYVRLAPGVVQFLQYGFRRSKPRILSYPLTAGTIAVVTNEIRAWGQRPSFTLLRRDDVSELPLRLVRNRGRYIERTWQALLSTAPTPPLSDEELVG